MKKGQPLSDQQVKEFHVERQLRSRYQIDDALFSQQGSIIFTDFAAVRRFVFLLNQKRDPRLHVYPGEVNAAGMLEEIYHYIIDLYTQTINPTVFSLAWDHLQKHIGPDEMDDLLYDFVDKFPPTTVFKGEISINKYLAGNSGQKPNLHLIIEEAIMLFFANFNPATKKLKELFDEKHLKNPDTFRLMMEHLEDFFEEQPPFGPDNQYIFDLFKTPILNSPDDISRQLDFILERWKNLLPAHIHTLLLRSKDLLREDYSFGTPEGDGAPTIAPDYKAGAENAADFAIGKSDYKYVEESAKDYEEPEAFTRDVHWMPSVVMIAKNTYVWLDQLSKKYQREIHRLDQIPDEELDLIKKWNFTGLWLIGIWERSEASRRIKHIMGNTDAVSSAYSLYDYQIALDLGGEDAYNNLNERTRARGIRLASDMVPNHTGIYSKWVIDHPDYFIQASQPPFPGYTFRGENLSQHPDYELRLEDGYYSRSDAAVVFQRVNKTNGQVRYIYHGNDGTNMPWNDTAQLDMLKHEVRQAVIEKIFEVARRFSIIRFDAAMTLAKKHFSRLWYPKPGTGGDIPSRADYAMTQAEFDALFPVEFWREVVDRMNAEMPETLLLAEAFWFMEGYFVRTLGMHRVYNSAFMHMLKNEENEKYRDLITNTLEFEPEILKRYVNFMSNPDEETAIRQFGTDDKYFGVCVLMNTLPGLPMFAHGQIEGYTEKYGMEYQRAYYNEDPQQWLIEKHEKQIFPITRKRYLFSEVENFNIFDFIDSYGNINENVFAYSNLFGSERALVLYNNKYEQAFGSIHYSAPRLTRSDAGKEAVSISLSQALGIQDGDNIYYIFKEHFSGLEYLRRGRDLINDGLQWNLDGFEYRLFWEFRQVTDTTGEYEKLLWKIGAGVPSVERARHETRLQPLHTAFEEIFSDDIMKFLTHRVLEGDQGNAEKLGYTLLRSRFENFLNLINKHFPETGLDAAAQSNKFIAATQSLEKAFSFLLADDGARSVWLHHYGIATIEDILCVSSKAGYRENLVVLLSVFALDTLFSPLTKDESLQLKQNLMLQWPIFNLLQRTGKGEKANNRDVDLIMILWQTGSTLFNFQSLLKEACNQTQRIQARNKLLIQKAAIASDMLSNPLINHFIGVNKYKGTSYFSKESFEELLQWLLTLAVLDNFSGMPDHLSSYQQSELNQVLQHQIDFWRKAIDLSERAGYELDKLHLLLDFQQQASE